MTYSREKGFTVIELMIAITLGLIITVAVTQAYLNGLGTQQAQSDVTRAQESSRFAFEALTHAIRKAGYKNPTAGAPGNFCASAPTRLLAKNDSAAVTPTTSDLSGSAVAIVNSSDIIRVRYAGESDGTIVDCLGNTVAANVVAEDTFFIAADSNSDNEPALFCYTSNAAASGNVALVSGVESMQLLYGEDSANTDDFATIDRYVKGSDVVNMSNVRAVMVSLVTRTKSSNAIDRSAQTINHFGLGYAPLNAAPSGDDGSVFTTPADGRLRQHAATTVALRNLCQL